MTNFAVWMLLLNVAATLAMVGLIWFVQIVHYPLFANVGHERFRRYEMEHQRLTSWVVAPLMLTELATAVLLLWWRPTAVGPGWVWLGIVLLALIWVMTYTVQVPQHASLVLSYDAAVQKRLVSSNWYRTAAWTTRGMLALWMVAQVLTSLTAGEHPASIAP